VVSYYGYRAVRANHGTNAVDVDAELHGLAAVD